MREDVHCYRYLSKSTNGRVGRVRWGLQEGEISIMQCFFYYSILKAPVDKPQFGVEQMKITSGK